MRALSLLSLVVAPSWAGAQSYGKYCGQSGEAGSLEPPPAKTPRDRLDAVCKCHDACASCGAAFRGGPKLVRVPLKAPKRLRINKKGKLRVKWAKTKPTVATQTPEACRKDFQDALRRMKRRYCRSKKFSAKRCSMVLFAQGYADTVRGSKATPEVARCVDMLRGRFGKAEWNGGGSLRCDPRKGTCQFTD